MNPDGASALIAAANQLGVLPEELASVIALESGFNPSIWGGTGGKYFGLIQFGPNERRSLGINPKIHNTFQSQMPKVVAYFNQRGFQGKNYKDPKERQMRLYNTVLGGNPNANTQMRDSFGTSVNSVLERMLDGGDLRERAMQFLSAAPKQTSDMLAALNEQTLTPKAPIPSPTPVPKAIPTPPPVKINNPALENQMTQSLIDNRWFSPDQWGRF